MQQLVDFVRTYSERTACRCGRCLPSDLPNNLPGHTANMVFFEVSAVGNPSPDDLRKLIQDNFHGEFGDLNPLDNREHSYIEVGGWLGDQGLALQLMGLGWLLGLWQCLTPAMLGLEDQNLVMQMAGAGLVSIVPRSKKN